MKEYVVKISHRALQDMEDIYTYIATELQAPDTARKQYDRIADGVNSLSIFPFRCKRFDSEPEHTMGLRQLLIDRYSILYIIDEDSVTVLRVLYSASDIITRLREEQ